MAKTTTKPKLPTVMCSICNRAISYDPTVTSSAKAIMAHKWAEHKSEMTQLNEKARAAKYQKAQERHGNRTETPPSSTVPPKEEKPKLQTATNVAEANIIRIVPKVFTVNSLLLQVAQKVCETEWGWPEMEMGDFIDTYFYFTMKQRGILLGAYQKLEKQGGNHGGS